MDQKQNQLVHHDEYKIDELNLDLMLMIMDLIDHSKLKLIWKILLKIENIFTVWFNRGIRLDFFGKFRLFEFFSSIGNELFVSATSGGSVEEFSLTNDADL